MNEEQIAQYLRDNLRIDEYQYGCCDENSQRKIRTTVKTLLDDIKICSSEDYFTMGMIKCSTHH